MGCHQNHGKIQNGPLSRIRNFDVYAFFSPYEKMDDELLFKTLTDSLNEVGNVEIIETSYHSSSSNTHPLIFLSLGGYQEEKKGYIKIVSPVTIDANQAKADCTIWHTSYQDTDLTYPIIEDGKVAFRKSVERDGITIDQSHQPGTTPESILRRLIANFATDYRELNASGEKPTFYVYRTKGVLPIEKTN